VKRAELMVIAARDATHQTELPNPITTETTDAGF